MYQICCFFYNLTNFSDISVILFQSENIINVLFSSFRFRLNTYVMGPWLVEFVYSYNAWIWRLILTSKVDPRAVKVTYTYMRNVCSQRWCRPHRLCTQPMLLAFFQNEAVTGLCEYIITNTWSKYPYYLINSPDGQEMISTPTTLVYSIEIFSHWIEEWPNFLKLSGLERMFSWNCFKNNSIFFSFVTNLKSFLSTTSRELRQQFAACSV